MVVGKQKHFKLKIEKLVYGGRGLGELNGRAVFVPFTAPGDVCIVKEVSRKSGYSEAELVELVKESPFRVKPKCPVFGKCGGCDWQHIDYEKQVEFKRQILEENLERLGKLKGIKVEKVFPSPSKWFYRNRAQFKVKNGKVGFFAKSSHSIVDVKKCFLLCKDISDFPVRLKSVLKDLPNSVEEVHVFYSSKKECLLRIFLEKEENASVSVEELERKLGIKIAGVGFYVQSECGIPKRLKFFGRDFTYEVFSHLKFRVSADSFFQVNRFLTETLIKLVSRAFYDRQFLVAGDIYCGVGTFTVPVAKYVHRAFGIEANFSAIADAIYNRDANGMRNITFFCKQAEESVDIIKDYSPDVVIFDPPRSGIHPKLLKEVMKLPRSKRMVYVSCNPSTLARDLSILVSEGFRIEKIFMLDMFPQTYHIESVVYLGR